MIILVQSLMFIQEIKRIKCNQIIESTKSNQYMTDIVEAIENIPSDQDK